MNADQIASLVRQILTFVGGYLVTKGIVDDGTLVAVVGAIATLASVGWSFFTHKAVVATTTASPAA
jgi:hypothetical protein